MFFSDIPIDDLRSQCRLRIEVAELSLKRLLDERLFATFGSNYFDQQVDGPYLIGSKIRTAVNARMQQHPIRFHKAVDAFQLGELALRQAKRPALPVSRSVEAVAFGDSPARRAAPR